MTKNQERARKTHEERMAQIEEQLRVINRELKVAKNEKNINWGHVGNLGYVTEQLRNVVNFLTGSEDEE